VSTELPRSASTTTPWPQSARLMAFPDRIAGGAERPSGPPPAVRRGPLSCDLQGQCRQPVGQLIAMGDQYNPDQSITLR